MSNIKIIEKVGKNNGKTIVLLAGVHGNEKCGVNAFDELIPQLEIESGRVIFIYANLEAIKQNKRCIEKNLNRCFLIDQSNEISESLEGRTAREIMPYLKQADVLLDIHQSFTKESLPFVILDEKNLDFGKIFDAEIVSFNWDPFEPGSTDYFMNLQNKPGICFECGAFLDPLSLGRAKKAIINFLIYFGNISGEFKPRENQKKIRIKSIYKNREYLFLKKRYLPDFWKAEEKTIIGKEGDMPVYAQKGDIVLFLSDSQNLNEECFLLAEETLINKENLTKLKDNAK
jgi:predicted deacylase